MANYLNNLEYCKELVSNVSGISNDLKINAIAELHALREIDNEATGVYRLNNNSIEVKVKTEPVILDKVELGRFLITVVSNSHSVKIDALDPNPHQELKEFVHPHISQGYPCLGQALYRFRHAMSGYRFDDAVKCIVNMLNTVSQEAKNKLYDWDKPHCLECKSTSKSKGECIECGGRCCHKCGRICKKCKESCHIKCGKIKSKRLKCNLCIQESRSK